VTALATLRCRWPYSESPPAKLRSHGPRDAASPGETQEDERREFRQGGQKARAAVGAGPQTFRRARGWNATTPATRTAMMNEQAWRLDGLREEARYRRERLELYRARMYGGRARSDYRLREYERASEGASARLSPSRSAALQQPCGGDYVQDFPAGHKVTRRVGAPGSFDRTPVSSPRQKRAPRAPSRPAVPAPGPLREQLAPQSIPFASIVRCLVALVARRRPTASSAGTVGHRASFKDGTPPSRLRIPSAP
jgi:hypothetical protein